jgi:DNA mismatch repair protein MutH
MMIDTPLSVDALLQRANVLVGKSLKALAEQCQVFLPPDSVKGKGSVGQLLELYLGATAGSLAEPDFQALGIELKTIPVTPAGRVLESTYISIVPLTQLSHLTFETSQVWAKLKKVLWIPIVMNRGTPISERIIGQPFLWQPNTQEEALLRQDWQELMDMIAIGQIESITARIGQVMQIRPKGANGRVLTQAIGPEGGFIKTLPRGFYLRTEFTQKIFQAALCI